MLGALLSSQLFWWSSIILLWTFFYLQQRDCKQFFDIYFTDSWQQVGGGFDRRGERQTGPGSEHEQRVGTLYKVQISSRGKPSQRSKPAKLAKQLQLTTGQRLQEGLSEGVGGGAAAAHSCDWRCHARATRGGQRGNRGEWRPRLRRRL